MNDFEKPIDTKVRETALRIMERAMFYNSTATTQDCTGSKPTFFVDFQGHTCCLYISVDSKGYGESSTTIRLDDFGICLCEREYHTVDEIQSKLEAVLNRMEEIYATWYEKEYPNE